MDHVNETDYEMPWRPNYEMVSVAGWAAGLFLAITTNTIVDLPKTPFVWMSSFCFFMFSWRAFPAVTLYKKKKRLEGFPLTFIKVSKFKKDLEKKQEKRKDDGKDDVVWLGEGFEWEQKHAQASYEILKRTLSRIIEFDENRMGALWIHGLSDYDKDIMQPIGHSDGHTLIVGTTGAGKTRLFDLLVTQAVLRGEAVFIIDPKGDKELKETARRACELSGSPERFVNFHPAFPEESCRFDALANYGRPTELASRVASITPGKEDGDPFKAYGQMAMTNLIQGMLFVSEVPSIMSLKRCLEGGPGKLVRDALTLHFDENVDDWKIKSASYLRRAESVDEIATGLVEYYREVVQDKKPVLEIEGLVSMFEHERTHFSKMIASLMPVLSMLTTDTLGELLSPTEDDACDYIRKRIEDKEKNPSILDEDEQKEYMEKLRKKEPMDFVRPSTNTAQIIRHSQVAYLGLDSLSDAMVGSAIGSLILADLASVAGSRYNFGLNNKPVNIFIDEAAEVINDPFVQILNKGRGALMRTYIATQTFADFSARTGSDAKARQILGNINNLIALRVMDSETQQYITDSLPKTRLKYVMRTQGMATHSSNPMLYAGNQGERLMEEEGDLFPPQLLGQLPNLQYIAKLSGGRIVKGRLPILVSDNYKES